MMILRFFAVIMLCVTPFSSAVFYEIEEWEHAETKQRIFCFSDAHFGHCQDQQDDLIWAAKKLDACVIAEDVRSYDGTNKDIKECFAQCKKLSSSLNHLIERCKQENVRCENVDYRFLGFLFKPLLLNYGLDKTAKKRLGDFDKFKKDMVAETDLVIQDLKSYNYGDQAFQEVHDELLAKTLINRGVCPLDGIIQEKDKDRQIQIANHSALSLAPLIELRTLQKLHKFKNTKYIFIPQGGLHILGLSQCFPKLGFKKNNQEGEQLPPLFSVADVLKMKINVGKCLKSLPEIGNAQSPSDKKKKACMDKAKGLLIMSGFLAATGAAVVYTASE